MDFDFDFNYIMLDDLKYIIVDYVSAEYNEVMDILKVIGDDMTVYNFPLYNCIIKEYELELVPKHRRHSIRTLLYTGTLPFSLNKKNHPYLEKILYD